MLASNARNLISFSQKLNKVGAICPYLTYGKSMEEVTQQEKYKSRIPAQVWFQTQALP